MGKMVYTMKKLMITLMTASLLMSVLSVCAMAKKPDSDDTVTQESVQEEKPGNYRRQRQQRRQRRQR